MERVEFLMKKSKLFIASIIAIIFGVLGVIVGLSDLRIDMIVFYISVLLTGISLFSLNKERQIKRQMQQAPFQMNVAPVIKNKGLKNWKTLLALAIVMFIIALFLPTPAENDDENNSSLTNATEVITEKLDEPTEKPTEKLTEKATEEVTEPPTEAPTEELTEEIAEEPTDLPTEKPTENTEISDNSNTYDNAEERTAVEYVLNTSTMKVHKPSCSSVSKISPENLQYTYDLNSVLASGYESCKKCNP